MDFARLLKAGSVCVTILGSFLYFFAKAALSAYDGLFEKAFRDIVFVDSPPRFK